ncbi:DUF7269 family protein [Haloarcula sp. NS06]|uniref:DUF7269 family protein n=1 Tax=unclassified Haloarcula TaxID=2624677 RepID=UPI0027AF7F03|nr:hypothetical protein [Haloarcula sp. H-GB4]MDQ2072230.1 hypothetical protein [Haloarcula sp. H-GB4]
MNRRHVGLGIAVLCGMLLVAAGAVIGLIGTPEPAASGPGAAGVLVLLVCVLVAVWKLLRTPDNPTISPSPWADDDGFTREYLETTPTDDAVSGTELAERVEAAVAKARDDGSVDESLDPVREPLRATLTEALVQGGHDPDTVKAQLAAGTWTDDPVAAAVLDESVTPPDRPFRARLRAWLFPEKAVRKRCGRAMAAVSVAADDALPAVVGQRAPRPMPVVAPAVADLQRAADGSLQRAVDGSIPEREDIGASADGASEDARVDGAGTGDGTGADDATSGDPETGGTAPVDDSGADTTATDRADWGDVTEGRN